MAKNWERAKAERRILTPDEAWAEDIRKLVIASCHPKQRAFVEDPARRVSARVGRGGGKTTGWRARAVIKAARIPRADILYIATTRTHAEELMWSPLKDLVERLGIDALFHETKLRCTFRKTGATIKLVGADDKKEVDKLRGKSRNEVGIDEAASFPPELLKTLLFKAIGPRLGDRRGTICMFGSPGHVLSGEFYDATRPSSTSHRPYEDRDLPEYADWKRWSSHHWTLKDGAEHIPALARLWEEALIEKEANQWSDDNPIWLREYMGEWAADDTESIYKYRAHVDGKPWNQWDPPRVGPMQIAKLPEDRKDWAYGFGLDLGVKDPFSLEVFAFSPTDPKRRLFHVFEFERPKMYAKPIAQLLLGEDSKNPLGVCDPEKPKGLIGVTGWPDGTAVDLAGNGEAVLLELMNVYGIRLEAAEKKGKFAAFELMNGHLIDGRIFILKGSKLEQQLLTLQWRANEVGELREDKAQANHSADAALYIIRTIGHLFTSEPEAKAQAARSPAPQEDGSRPPSDPIESPEGDGGEFSWLLSEPSYDDAAWGND